VLFDESLERIACGIGGLDQALRAARHIGDNDGRAARGALGV
jgi:hypothetical protein